MRGLVAKKAISEHASEAIVLGGHKKLDGPRSRGAHPIERRFWTLSYLVMTSFSPAFSTAAKICSGFNLDLSYFTEKARFPTFRSTISRPSNGLRAPRTVAAHPPHGTLASSKLAMAMASTGFSWEVDA